MNNKCFIFRRFFSFGCLLVFYLARIDEVQQDWTHPGSLSWNDLIYLQRCLPSLKLKYYLSRPHLNKNPPQTHFQSAQADSITHS